MRILHVGKFYPPEWGGIESVTEALAVDHASQGHELTVLCFSQENDNTQDLDGVRVERFRSLSMIASQPLSFRYVWRAIRRGRKADIVHLHTPNLLASLISLFLTRTPKVVVHWHADIENKGLAGKLVLPLEHAMLRRADHVVATTAEYAMHSNALEDFKDKLVAIPIGIDDMALPQADESLGDYILFVGRLVPYKGVDVLLDAMTHVPEETSLRIVGTGPLEHDLKAQVKMLGLQNRVFFEGKTELARLHQLYAGATLFCLPSVNRLEAFGVVLIEAMRAKLPLITTEIVGSGVLWVNEDQVSGYRVPVGDSLALASAINRILNNPKTRQDLSLNARNRYLTYFSRSHMSADFMSIYQG